MFRNRATIRKLLLLSFLSFVIFSLIIAISPESLTHYDYKLLGYYHAQAIIHGKIINKSTQITYLAIDDQTKNKYITNQYLYRDFISKTLPVISSYNPEAIAFDMIFNQPSDSISDKLLALSISQNGKCYLPIGLGLNTDNFNFSKIDSISYDIVKPCLKAISQNNYGNCFKTNIVLPQLKCIQNSSYNTGHISIHPDYDEVYRKAILIIKVGNYFVPSLSLQIYLDYIGVPFEKLYVDWGKELVIPAIKGSWLEHSLRIPIDNKGCIYIAYSDYFGKDFPIISLGQLLDNKNNLDIGGNISELISGRFVFLGDFSTSSTDIGNTTIEQSAPLIEIHTATLNSLLNQQFYYYTSKGSLIFIFFCITVILCLVYSIKKIQYGISSSLLLVIALLLLSWYSFINFYLLPIATILFFVVSLSSFIIILLQLIERKESKFIRNAFSKYVSEKVIKEIVNNPGTLKLGGQRKNITVLFCDIANFTTISETIESEELVRFLNNFLSEISDIIMNNGGIVDKYIGDCVMALFGAPLDIENHADVAVKTAIDIQRKISELQKLWNNKNFPLISVRIGINTGDMILGNIGSKHVFDYTVIGDNVNLASRLESVNKEYGTNIIISESTFNSIDTERFYTRFLDIIKVKGKNNAVKIYEVYDLNSEIPQFRNYYKLYDMATFCYFSKQFVESERIFTECLVVKENDLASKMFLERIKSLDLNSIDENWDGVHKMFYK